MSVSALTRWTFVGKQQHIDASRHLYRALLREASYLPDAASRDYIKKLVIKRFRIASGKGIKTLQDAHQEHALEFGKSNASVAKEELGLAFRKGYKNLYQLIRANEGELKPLLRVLRYTYGRAGPYRHALLGKLLTPDPSDEPAIHDTEESAMKWDITTVAVPKALVAPSNVTGDTMSYSIDPRFSRLNAIIQSQVVNDVHSNRTTLKKRISVPTTNAWGRSMPRRRVKNIVKDRYANLLDAIMPPLPEHQWAKLQDLVHGNITWAGAPHRRVRPARSAPALTASDCEKLAHHYDGNVEPSQQDPRSKWGFMSGSFEPQSALLAHTEPASASFPEPSPVRGYWNRSDAWLTNEEAVDDALEQVMLDEIRVQGLNKNLRGKERGHRMTLRFMQRMWLEIFKTCPVLRWDEGKQAWEVEWGTAKGKPEIAADDSARLKDLFGGLDSSQSAVNKTKDVSHRQRRRQRLTA